MSMAQKGERGELFIQSKARYFQKSPKDRQ